VNRALLQFHSLKSPLAQRLIVAVVLFSVVITLAMTAFQVHQEYQRSLLRLEAQLRQIEAVHLPTLSRSLWATNREGVQLELEGMVREPNIVNAVVHEAGRSYAQAGGA